MDSFPTLVSKTDSPQLETSRKTYSINDVELSIIDYATSVAADVIAAELSHNIYPFAEMAFRPGDTVLDLGGHVGMVSIYLAKIYPFITIYSYEPTPANYEHFLLNLEVNRVQNVEVFKRAVTEDGRSLDMIAKFEVNSGGATSNLRDMRLPDHSYFKAESTTLDAIFIERDIRHCKLLKIDIEGSEHEVLLHSNCLSRIEYLVGEFHINENLERKGYSIESLHEHLKRFIPESNVTFTSCRMAE
jgi:FkbM family methyltransferase